jgi:hypothetical protein
MDMHTPQPERHEAGRDADDAPAEAHGEAQASSLPRFLARVEQQFRIDRLESFWTLQEDFRELAGSGFAAARINEELARVVDNPSHMGDWRPNQCMIHRGRDYSLSLCLIEENRRYIHSSAAFAMCAPVGSESLAYRVYRLPEEYHNAVFDSSIALEPAGTGITAPGGVLLMQSDRFVYDFQVGHSVTVLKFATASIQPLEWLFSKDTLHAWQANDSELAWTQLRVAAYILGRLAEPSSLEPLQELSSHPHHAVRWAAIQNLGRLSRRAAVARLRKAVNDPHPHVRRAAVKTLQQQSPK